MYPINAFLMQPYNVDHANILRETVKKVAEKVGCDVWRADEKPIDAGPRLQDRIDAYIKKSDIGVADCTSTSDKPINSNVLLEVGAALALQIPVVIIANQALPSNIRGNIYLELDPKDLVDNDKKRFFEQMLQIRIEEAINQIGHARTENFVAHGYPDREGIDFNLLIRRTERRIYVLTTNLGYVVGKKPAIQSAKNEKNILNALIEEVPKKKKDSFETRILALDPDSNYTNERADSLGRSRREFREEVRKNLDTLTKQLENVRGVEIKVYDEYPLQMTFFFDDIIVNSAVAASRSSRYCVTYIHNLTYRSVRDTFEKHFDELWGRSIIYGLK